MYGGIPHAHLTIAPTAGIGVGTPIVFVGLGQLHASKPLTWDLDLIGGGTRLQRAQRDRSTRLPRPSSR